MCKICGTGAETSRRPPGRPCGDSQAVPRRAIARCTTPPLDLVTWDVLGHIATQSSVSGCALSQLIVPRPWARSSADSPDQPNSVEDASNPCGPYFPRPYSSAPADLGPPTDSYALTDPCQELSTIHPSSWPKTRHPGEPVRRGSRRRLAELPIARCSLFAAILPTAPIWRPIIGSGGPASDVAVR
jgi:hypothetical protein